MKRIAELALPLLMAAACASEPAERLLPVLAAREAPAASASADAEAGTSQRLSAERFVELVEALSEPDSDFFSDNHISNETSYLQVAAPLTRHVEPGGAYIGVGPEQNFTYIALTRPSRAYIVDIRRDNLALQLLYKGLFDAASDRAHFLALLTGRSYDASEPLAGGADIEAVIARAERTKASAASFRAAHDAVLARFAAWKIPLEERDRRTMLRAHEAFHEKGLDLRFQLKEASFRRYPALREILAARCPTDGEPKGFLASDAAFRYLQIMQREHRIVPLVGDFAGERALPNLAEHLKRDDLQVASFYVSNVEQYLLEDGVWWKWRRNVALFPIDQRSVFIRAYLDQGKPHPRQLQGHRTTSTLQRIADFNAHERTYASLLALSTDRVLE
jgi:hypothetical protein